MHSSDEIAILIPARIGSTRLPRKPLIKVEGKPIIQWVYERASESKLAGNVIVATDDKEIYDTVQDFGGKVAMTSPHHKSGSDRIAEIVRENPDIKIAVNVQGDEPLITPESIDTSIRGVIEDEMADISTLVRKFDRDEDYQNPNTVKVVFDNQNYALYFSRSPVPFPRNTETVEYFAHIGLYCYRRESLLKLTELPQSMMEKAESLEQLRALYNGMKIKALQVDYKPVGIDTEEDLEKFQSALKST